MSQPKVLAMACKGFNSVALLVWLYSYSFTAVTSLAWINSLLRLDVGGLGGLAIALDLCF